MKSLTVALSLSFALIATGAFGQLALRPTPQPKRNLLRQADYEESHLAKSHVKQVQYDDCSEDVSVGTGPDCGCESLFPDCGCESYTPDCGCETFTPDCGAEYFADGCAGAIGGNCGGTCGGLLGGGGLFGTGPGLGLGSIAASCDSGCDDPCACSVGQPRCIPYPRCFLFKSPCLSSPCGVDPCCGTIFSEMWCDVKSWMGSRHPGPSAACCGGCPRKPFGFGNCSQGLLSSMGQAGGCGGLGGCGGCGTCFQDLLQPRCVGDCGCRPAPLRTIASALFGGACSSCGVVMGSCGEDCSSPVIYDGGTDGAIDGFVDGEYYDSYESHSTPSAPAAGCPGCNKSASRAPSRSTAGGNSARYFSVVRPGSTQTEYVTAQEYAMIEAQRATRAEQIARKPRPTNGSPTTTARRPAENNKTSQRPRSDAQSRHVVRTGVARASFQSKKPGLKLNSPRLAEEALVDPYIQFHK